jgi:hypothetical protein
LLVSIGGSYYQGTTMKTNRIEINPAVMMGKPVILRILRNLETWSS